MQWFKVDAAGWIRGSIRTNMTIEQRSVWIDLLAFASECRMRDGTMRFAEGKPMDIEYIANILRIPVSTLKDTIELCAADKNIDNDKHRIEVWADGTIQIANWEKYQSVPVNKTRDDATSRVLKERRNTRHATVRYPDESLDALVENVGPEAALDKLQDIIKGKQERGEIDGAVDYTTGEVRQ